jgi:hypothetical protein
MRSLSSRGSVKLHTIRWMVSSSILRFAGHVARMDNSRITKMLMFGTLNNHINKEEPASQNFFHGKWNRYRDAVHKIIEEREVPRACWYQMAQERKTWRRVVKGTWEPDNPLQQRPTVNAGGDLKRPPVLSQRSTSIVHCPICNHECKGRQGLSKHMGMKHQENTFRADGLQCAKCSRKFVTETELAAHTKLHDSGDDKWKECRGCKGIWSNAAFEGHVRYCEKVEASHHCQVEGCKYRTDDDKHLTVHMSTKHGVRASKICDLCGQDCRVPSGVTKHRDGPKCRRNRGLSPIKKIASCELCGMEVAIRQMTNHIGSKKCNEAQLAKETVDFCPPCTDQQQHISSSSSSVLLPSAKSTAKSDSVVAKERKQKDESIRQKIKVDLKDKLKDKRKVYTSRRLKLKKASTGQSDEAKQKLTPQKQSSHLDDDDAAQSFTYFRPPGMSGILQASERLRRRSENYAQLRKLTDAAEQKSKQMQERR